MRHKIERDQLASSIVVLAAERKGMEDALNTLELEISAVSSQWSGEEQQAFVQEYTRWMAQMRALIAILARSVDVMRNAHGRYDEAYRVIDSKHPRRVEIKLGQVR